MTAREWTDEELKKLERKLSQIYTEAYKGVSNRASEYFSGYDEWKDGKLIHHPGMAERYAIEKKKYEAGEYTKSQFEAWCRSQIGRGADWEAYRDQMAERLTDANVLASDYANKQMPKIYAENANREAFEIEKNAGVSFQLVNEDAVKQLSTGHRELWPKMSIDMSADGVWNKAKLQNALLQGLLQGESVGKIADRFQAVSNMNRSSAIRNARTACTAAENSGRQETFDRAVEMGIEIEKEWVATEDDRTRESHAMIDGVRVPYDEEFPNGLMYPGDPHGEPEEVYNCRCAMRSIIKNRNDASRYTDHGLGMHLNTRTSYEEWRKEKARKGLWYQED